MAWLILAAAGLLEVVWAVALKQADGFTRLWPSVLGLGAAGLSLFMLSVALRSLPAATAYAVWVGIGIVGVALVGILALGEDAGLARLGFLALIFIGIAGLRVTEG
jgi:quaternary ammonium compound-resistance protein SugE